MLQKFRRNRAASRLVQEQLYEHVASELAQGVRREGLWAKALADAAGSTERAQGLYIKYRVQSLSDEAEIVAAIAEEKANRIEQAQVSKPREDTVKKDSRQAPKANPKFQKPMVSNSRKRSQSTTSSKPNAPSPPHERAAPKTWSLSDTEVQVRVEEYRSRLAKQGIELKPENDGWLVRNSAGEQEFHHSIASLQLYVELVD